MAVWVDLAYPYPPCVLAYVLSVSVLLIAAEDRSRWIFIGILRGKRQMPREMPVEQLPW